MPSFQLEWSTGSNHINQFHQLSLTIAPVVLLLSKPDRVMNSDPCLSFIIRRGPQYIPYFNCFTKLICPSPMSANRADAIKIGHKVGSFPLYQPLPIRLSETKPSLKYNIVSLLVHMDVILADRGKLLCFLYYKLRIIVASRQQK